MDKELHVFILWERGRYLAEPILADINQHFKILQTFNVTWPKQCFAANLAKFYGKNLPRGCRKERECGDGEFLLAVVEDQNPVYEGSQNSNMTNAKGKYRRWFQGRNYIHCSDCAKEGCENLQMLLGLSVEEFYNKYAKSAWNGKTISHHSVPADDGFSRSWLLKFNNLSKQLLQNLNLW